MSTRNITLVGDDDPEPDLPGYRNIAIYCDESGMHRGPYYGFGSLWIPWERRGALSAIVGRLRAKHGYRDEAKWSSVNTRSYPFYKDLVSEFFARRWLMFHCIVVRRSAVNVRFHDGRDMQLRKHFGLLLRKKIAYFARAGADRRYRVRVDPLPTRYAREHEAVGNIVNAQLRKDLADLRHDLSSPLIHDIRACDSARTVGIQVSDVLLGAVLAAWQQQASAAPKLNLCAHVAAHLGWSDLRSDTKPFIWKFNIWHSLGEGEPREVDTRPVNLRYSMPSWRPR
jgi:hypothetical protein